MPHAGHGPRPITRDAFRVWGSGLKVQGSGLRVEDSGIQGPGVRVQDLVSKVWSQGSRVLDKVLFVTVGRFRGV